MNLNNSVQSTTRGKKGFRLLVFFFFIIFVMVHQPAVDAKAEECNLSQMSEQCDKAKSAFKKSLDDDKLYPEYKILAFWINEEDGTAKARLSVTTYSNEKKLVLLTQTPIGFIEM